MLLNNKNIKWLNIMLVVLIIGFLKPPAFVAFPIVDKIFNLLRVFSAIVVFFCVSILNVGVSRITKSIIVYQIFFVIDTFFQKGNTVQAIILAITIAGEVCAFELGIRINYYFFINSICIIMSSYIIINVLSILLFPNGIIATEMGTPIYFLGIHNRFVFWMLPCICYLTIRDLSIDGKICVHSYIIFLLCIFPLILKNAAGATIGLLIAGVLIKFTKCQRSKFNDYRLYLILYFAFWLGLTFFDILGKFEWLTSGIFHKSGSLIERLNLWRKAKGFLSTAWYKLLFGFGLESSSIIKKKFWYNHLHNNLMNVIYQTGIIGAVIYSMPFLRVIDISKKNKSNEIINVVSIFVFSFLIMLLMDTYDTYGHFYTILVFAGNIEHIKNKQICHMLSKRNIKLA